MSTASTTSLAGRLRVAPGTAVPHSLHSTRQDWAARLAPGRAPAQLPGLMASLFNLCSHAHRLCSALAVEAAAPGLIAAPQAVAQRLRTETAQEHARRIGLDWPRLLAPADGPIRDRAADALRRCPLMQAAPAAHDPWPAALAWLQHELLQMPATTWLLAWQACGADWLLDWSHRHRHSGWLATLVRRAREADSTPPLDPATALRAHASAQGQRTLSAALVLKPGFALHPQWHGASAHTGSWTRLNDRTAHPSRLTPWALLGSRLAELARLCLPDAPGQGGAGCLSHGALCVGDGQGLAWVEMARGLLVHQVVVSGHGDDARVRACHVLAPTEWNFHPQGEVAQRIAALDAAQPAEDTVRQVGLLMAAFDPCVPFELAPAASEQEVHHA